MGTVTFRVRSIAWFITGGLLAAAVTVMFLNAWRVDAAPGDGDATFVPITPCRLADTRPAPNRVGTTAALGVADTQTFAVRGANGECTIPTDAVAVSMNVTALNATVQSFLTFWPDGIQPLAASLNPAPGEPPTPNAVTVDLSSAGGFNVYNDTGTVNVVIDINGYYTASSLQELAARLEAVEADADANSAAVVMLNAAQPFVVTNDYTTIIEAESSWTDIIDVTLTAPVDGKVTVIATLYAYASSDGSDLLCGVNDENAQILYPNRLFWEAGTNAGGSHSSGSGETMSPVRTLDISAGETVTYYLMCRDESGGTSPINAPIITAIFTPAP